ncbi:MAG TPA: hypothetical protein HPP89_07455, partial [Gammaproteobacteria bacterium]|nr:hypothetical protein [Gammaproteobacteria bacterium]
MAEQIGDETVENSQARLAEIERQFLFLLSWIVLLLGAMLWMGSAVGRGIVNNIHQTSGAIKEIESSGDF